MGIPHPTTLVGTFSPREDMRYVDLLSYLSILAVTEGIKLGQMDKPSTREKDSHVTPCLKSESGRDFAGRGKYHNCANGSNKTDTSSETGRAATKENAG